MPSRASRLLHSERRFPRKCYTIIHLLEPSRASTGLVAPKNRRVGFGKRVEVTSDTGVNLMLPASAQLDVESVRLFANAGYFTRGSLFCGGTIAAPVSSRVTALGDFSHANSSDDNPLSDQLGLSAHRSDFPEVPTWRRRRLSASSAALGARFSLTTNRRGSRSPPACLSHRARRGARGLRARSGERRSP